MGLLQLSCSFFSQLPAAPRHCKALSKLWAREPHVCLGCRVKLRQSPCWGLETLEVRESKVKKEKIDARIGSANATASASTGVSTGRSARPEACVKPTWVLL